MIGAFESTVRQFPQRTCFTYVDEAGNETAYSYRETRMLSAALARLLLDRGVRPGDCVAVDLPNDPAYVLVMLAAAYGGFALVALNNRLTDAEKYSRLLDIDRKPGVSLASLRVDATNVSRLLEGAKAMLTGEMAAPSAVRATGRGVRPSFAARVNAASAEPRTTKALGRASSSRASLLPSQRSGAAGCRRVSSTSPNTPRTCSTSTPRRGHVHVGHHGRAKAVSLTWETSVSHPKRPTGRSIVAARACGRRCCRSTISAVSRSSCAAC
ncbi:MAG: AMP-binding protein [Eggerthella lenta]